MEIMKIRNLLILVGLTMTLTTVLADLPYNVQRRVAKVLVKLNQTELDIANANKKQATTNLDEASKELNYIYEYYGDKFDKDDTQIVSIAQRIKEYRIKILAKRNNKPNENSGVKSSISTTIQHTSNSELKTLLPVLTAYNQQFSPQIKQVQNDLRTLSSVLQVNDLIKINTSVIACSNSINALNNTLSPVQSLIKQLKLKHPDLQKTMTQGQTGADVSKLIRTMDANLESWNKQRLQQAKKWIQESKSALSQTTLVMAQVKQMPADVRGPMVKQFVDLLKTPKTVLSIIPALYPLAKTNQYSAEVNNILDATTKQISQYPHVEAQMSKMSKSAASEIQKQLDVNRFPTDLSHNQNDETEIKRAYLKALEVNKILRIGISRNWHEKTQAHWVNNVLVVNTYKYINVWLAHKTSSGNIRAYNTTFRKTKNADGSWNALEYWSVGTSYEILIKNLNL